MGSFRVLRARILKRKGYDDAVLCSRTTSSLGNNCKHFEAVKSRDMKCYAQILVFGFDIRKGIFV